MGILRGKQSFLFLKNAQVHSIQKIFLDANKLLFCFVRTIDDPLEAFERMLREKDERDRRLAKQRRRSRTRSRSRSYTRSRSRSFGRRSPHRMSRSRSPPPKRRSPRSPASHRPRSRTPKRRSRSGSFSMSRYNNLL